MKTIRERPRVVGQLQKPTRTRNAASGEREEAAEEKGGETTAGSSAELCPNRRSPRLREHRAGEPSKPHLGRLGTAAKSKRRGETLR